MPEPFPAVNRAPSHVSVTMITQAENGISIAVSDDVQRLYFLLFAAVIASPAMADLRLEVDLSERMLVAWVDGQPAEQFQVAVGKDKYPTPTGSFEIAKVIWNPAWHPPDSKWARGKTPKPPGHPDNPMKRVKLFFKEPTYYIHGTGELDSLGKARSHGCVRMDPDDVTRLAQLVMEHGGEPKPEPWYRRIFRRKSSEVVRLSLPVPLVIAE